MSDQIGSSGLLDVLVKSVIALGLGFASVRSKGFEPSQGHTAALAFYVGKIALPLLTFNLLATSKLGDVKSNSSTNLDNM